MNPQTEKLRKKYMDNPPEGMMLSLFLSITVFTSVMTVVNGIDIDNYINSEYDYDFYFTADMNSTYFLDEGFVEQVQQNNGIKDTSATRISSVE